MTFSVVLLLLALLVQTSLGALIEQCSCNSTCVSFGDPHMNNFNGVHSVVKCGDGTSLNLYNSPRAGIAIEVTCAGAWGESRRHWISEVKSSGSIIFSMEDCKTSFDAAPSNFVGVTKIVPFSVPGGDGVSMVNLKIGCYRLPSKPMNYKDVRYPGQLQFEMTKTNGNVPSAYQTASLFSHWERDYYAATGFCLPPMGDDGVTRSNEKVCTRFGYDADCQVAAKCDKSSCTQCYNSTGDVCETCRPNGKNCAVDNDCCGSGTCSIDATSGNKTCSGGTDTTTMECCSTLGCSPDSSGFGTGTCENCIASAGVCSSSSECCGDNVCENGICGGAFINSVPVCSCSAKCKAVADPHIRSFISYGKHVTSSSDIVLFKRASSGTSTSSGNTTDAVTVKQICNVDNPSKCWINQVLLNGVVVADVEDCNLVARLPANPSRQIRQRNFASFQLKRASVANFASGNAVPLSDELQVVVQCVTKKAIEHEGSRPNSRLDVYLNKEDSFVQPAGISATAEMFMYNSIANGMEGTCYEPYVADTGVLMEVPDSPVPRGWTSRITADTQPSCTCTTVSDTDTTMLQTSLRNRVVSMFLDTK